MHLAIEVDCCLAKVRMNVSTDVIFHPKIRRAFHARTRLERVTKLLIDLS